MPANKRPRRERTDEWQHIEQYSLWPEQKIYELLRPVVLFNEPVADRALETGASARTVSRKSAQFRTHGMASLFQKEVRDGSKEKSRSLPPDMRQLIVDLKTDHPGFRERSRIDYSLSSLVEVPRPHGRPPRHLRRHHRAVDLDRSSHRAPAGHAHLIPVTRKE